WRGQGPREGACGGIRKEQSIIAALQEPVLRPRECGRERTIVGRGNDIYDLVCDEYPCRWLLNGKGRDASLCSLAVLAALQLALHLTLAIIREGDNEW